MNRLDSLTVDMRLKDGLFHATYIEPVSVAVDVLLGKPMPPQGNLALLAGFARKQSLLVEEICSAAIQKSLER